MGLTLFFVLALVAGSQAGPIQEIVASDKCSQTCTVSNKFNYQPGKTYDFQYVNEIRTAIQGASEDHAGVQLSANVHIYFHDKCEAILRLSDVTLKEHDPSISSMKEVTSDIKQRLERNSLRFSYQDGNIDQICLTSTEEPAILNIKRGILSVFQNSMDDVTKAQTVKENDVAGTCEAEYTSTEKGWYNLMLKKSKNLLGCTGRHGIRSVIQGIPYDSNSNVQSLPLVKSTHECEQEITKSTGRLNVATCNEKHMFVPFSRQDSGAITHNTQTLKYVKESQSSQPAGPVASRASLQFDHDDDANKGTTKKELEKKLLEVCESTKKGATADTPSLFRSLVYTMKTMEATEMIAVYRDINSRSLCPENNDRVKKFFFDALPMTGTTEAIKLMTQFIVAKEVTGIEADMWLTTLAFIQNPTIDMLTEVKPLLAMQTNEEKAMLSVSSLVNSLCRNNPSCDNFLEVKKIISMLENKIAPGCKVTSANSKTTLIALRAIGNAGFGTGAIPTLVKCFERDENPTEVRLSAIEAFRRIPCKADRSRVFSIFSNTEEDSEVRIAAYKSLMSCPSENTLAVVKSTLKNEEVNQVGSYVWSHLTNLMETSDPHKQSIKAILEDDFLQKEFDMDQRKFSRNYEGSMFIEKLNTGATVDADLIWSSKSFIPRSGMLNLTVDLFGNAVNLFEVGGRAEGLEYFLESYFGPNGYFSENDVKESPEETAVAMVRSDKVNRIHKRMNTVMDQLRGSMYMRVFGNELRYMDFDGLESLLSQNSFNIMELLNKLTKKNDYQFTHSSMFIDTTFSIPTSSGFPLKLMVNGTATIDIQASGKFDILKLSSKPPTLDINGLVKPSGTIQISSMMSVDAFVTKVGVKMVSTLHSSSSVQGRATLSENKLLNVEFDLPEKKMDILSFKSSFFTMHRDMEREQQMITENKREKSVCTGDRLAKITGLELCGEMKFSNASLVENAPYFPLTGPVMFGLSLNKRDTLTGYKLQAKSIHNKDSNTVHVSFSTPNSKVDRSFGVDFNLNKADGTFDTGFTTPWKSGDFKGTFTYEKRLKAVSGRLNWDGTTRYEVKAMFESKPSGPGMLYTPSITVKVPGQTSKDLTGTIKYAPWKLFETDLSLSGLTETPISLKTLVLNKLNIMRASANLMIAPKKEYTFDSSLQILELKKKLTYAPQISIRTPTAEVLAFGGSINKVFGRGYNINLNLDRIVSKKVSLKSIITRRQFRRGKTTYVFKNDFRSGPVDLRIGSKSDIRSMKAIASNMDITYVIRKYARDNIKLVTKVNNLSTKSLTKGKGSIEFTSNRNPERNFNIEGAIDHNRKTSEIVATTKYGSNPKDTSKHIELSASVERNIESWKKASMNLFGEFKKGEDLRLLARFKHTHDPKSMDSSLTVRKNTDAIMGSVNLKDQSKDLLKMEGTFDLTLPGKIISLSKSLEEKIKGEYTSIVTARIGKSKSNIESVFSANKLRSDITIDGKEPVTIQGEYNIQSPLKAISISLKKGSSKYSASSTAQIDTGKSVQFSADIECPTRRIVAHFEDSKSGQRYTTRADLRWNADRDDTQRVTVRGNSRFEGLDNFDNSITLQYPTRTVEINVKHSSTNKYASHIDFLWEPNKQFSADSTFSFTNNEILGTLQLKSPYKSLRKLDISLNHQIDDLSYTSKLDIEWNPKQILSTTLTLRRPFSLSGINAEFIAKTPFSFARNMEASYNHKTQNGLIANGKVNWNKQSLQAGLVLTNKGNEKQADVRGQLDIKTSFKELKTASVAASFFSNGMKTTTGALLQLNKASYKIDGSVVHKINGWNVNNNGELIILTPFKEIKAEWQHSNTLKDMTVSTTISWDKNKSVFIKYNGLQEFNQNSGKLVSSLEIKTPLASMNDILLQLQHEHKPGQIDSLVKALKDGSTVAFAEGKYQNNNGQLTSKISLSNPVLNGDVSFKLNSAYNTYPKTLEMEMALSPLQKVDIDMSFDKQETGNIETMIIIASPKFSTVTFKGMQRNEKLGVESSIDFEYMPGKSVTFKTLHSISDNNKKLAISFSSPVTEKYSAEVAMQTSKNVMNANAFIDIQPYIGRWSSIARLDKSNGISGNLRINTPLKIMPFTDVSFSTGMLGSVRQSEIAVEFVEQKIIRVASTLDIKTIQNIKLNLELSTPYEELSYAAVKYDHVGDISGFNCNGEIEYSKGKHISANAAFSRKGGLDVSLSLKTPFADEMRTLFSHQGNLKNMKSHGEITWGKTLSADFEHRGDENNFASILKLSDGEHSLGGNIKFALQPKLTSELEINTPFTGLFKISNSLERTDSRFSNKAEISTETYGRYSAYAALDLTDSITGEITIETPINGYKKMAMQMSHTGSINSSCQSRVEFSLGPKVISSELKLKTNPAFNVELKFETPVQDYKLLRLSLVHEGGVRNFKSHLEAQRNKQTTEADIDYNFEKKLDVDLTIRPPSGQPFKASIDHSGSWKRFNNKVRFTQGKSRYMSEIRFQLKPTFNSLISLRTPHSWLKNQQLSIKHTGSAQTFKCNMQYRNNGKIYTGDASFQNIESLKAELNLKGHGIPPVSASISHDGPLRNFKSSAALQFGKKTFAADSSFNAVNGVKTSIAIKSPFTSFSDFSAGLTHTGSMNNFKTRGEVVFNKKIGSMDLTFDPSNENVIRLTVSSPFRGYEDISYSLKHSGILSNFNTVSSFILNGNNIEGKLSFENAGKVTGTVSVSSSYSFIGNHEAKFNFEGNMKKFNYGAKISAGQKHHEVSLTFDSTNNYDARASIRSPLFPHTEVGFMHDLTGKSLNSNAFISVDGMKLYEILADISTLPAVNGLIKIGTPFESYKNTELSVKYETADKAINSFASLAFGSQMHEIEISADIHPDLTTRVSFRSPLYKDIDTSFFYRKQPKELLGSFEFLLDSKNIVKVDTSLIKAETLSADFKFLSPLTKNLKLSFNHDGTMKEFTSEAEMIYGGKKSFVQASVRTSPDISTVLKITSPIIDDIEINLGHSGQISNCKTNGNVKYNGKTLINLKSSIFFENSINADLQLDTVVPGVQHLNFVIDFDKVNEGFTTNGKVDLNGKVLSVNTAMNTREGSFVVKTPLTNDLHGSYEMFGSTSSGKGKAKFSYGSNDLLKSAFNMKKSLDGDISIASPALGLEETKLTLKHEPTSFGFQNLVELSIFGLTHSLQSSWENGNKIEGSFQLLSPYTRTVAAEVELQHSFHLIFSHGKFIYGDSTYETELSLRTGSDINGNFLLVVPGNNINMSLSFVGDLTSFKSHSDVSVNDRVNSLDVSFSSLEGFDASINMKSPYIYPIEITTYFNGRLKDFTSKFQISYNSDVHKINVASKYDDNYAGSFAIDSPAFLPLRGEATLKGRLANFDSSVQLTIGRNTHAVDTSVKITSNKVSSSLNIRSPIQNARMSFDYEGKITNFHSTANIEYGGKTTDAVVIINLESAKMGSILFTSPITEPIQASFELTGQLPNFENTVALSYGKTQVLDSKVSFQKLPLQGKVNFKSIIPRLEDISGSFSHTGEVLNFKNHAEITISGEKTEGDIFFNFGSKLAGSVSVRSPYFVPVSAAFDLSGYTQNVNATFDISIANDEYACEFSLDCRNNIDGSLTVTSPIEGYRKIIGKVSHSGIFPNTVSTIQLKTGRRTLASVGLQLSNTGKLSAKFSASSVSTPAIQVNIEHKGQMSNFEINADASMYGKTISTFLTARSSPSVDWVFSMRTPMFEPVTGKFSFQNTQNEIRSRAEGGLGGKVMVGDFSLDYGKDFETIVTFITPFLGFENIKGLARYSNTYKGFNSMANIELNNKRKFEFESTINWRQGLTGSIMMKTPFAAFKSSSAELSVSGTFPNIKSDIAFSLNEEKYSVKAEIEDGSQTNVKLMVATPLKGFENVGVLFDKTGKKLADLQASARLIFPREEEIYASIQSKLSSDGITIKSLLQTPYTEDILFDLSHNGEPFDFSNTVSASIGNENSITVATTVKIVGTSMNLDASLATVLAGHAYDDKLEISYEGSMPSFKASANAKVFGHQYSADSYLNIDSNANGRISIKTPVQHLQDVAFSFDITKNQRSLSLKSELKLDTDNKIDMDANFVNFGWRRMQTSFGLKTPFEGFEKTKLTYRHTASVDSFECNAEASALNTDIDGNLQVSLSPFETKLTISTPFAGFEQINADFKLNYGSDFYNTEANFALANGKTISITSEMNLKTSPFNGFVRVVTPFSGFEATDLKYSLSGNARNFRADVLISTPFFPSMRAAANMNYNSIFDVDAEATFASQIRGFENLKLSIKNVANRNRYDSQIESSWAPSKSIVLNTVFTDRRDAMSGSISLKTPFENVQNVDAKVDVQKTGDDYVAKIFTALNRYTYADFDVSAVFDNKMYTKIQMRSPIQFKLDVDGTVSYDKYDGSILFSRNIRESSDAFTVQGSFDRKTNSLSLSHKCNSMTAKFEIVSDQICKADVFVNDNHYGYEVILSGGNKRVKVILPERSLQLSGSSSYRTTEGSFMWDADNDQNKKIGFRSVLTPSSNSMKADLTLMMPSIGKDVQIDSEMTMNKDRIIFDGKTELTYSRDSRKKITLTSRLQDISTSWSSKNYSFVLGISHPYTSVDIQLSSHLGESNEQLSGGLDIQYLTVRRNTQTFSVNGELNKLKKTVSFDMDTPVKKISIDGSSQARPFRVIFTNKYDNKQPLNTVFSIDSERRSINFEMNYDIDNPSNEFHVSAKYVNSSAISAEVFHVINRQRVIDALFAVRLNNSRLLHNRIHWRPTMMQDLKMFIDRKNNGYSDRLAKSYSTVASEVAQEMRSKASLIKRSLTEEARPIVEAAMELYETNEYVRTIADAAVGVCEEIRATCDNLDVEMFRLIRERLSNCLEKSSVRVNAFLKGSLDSSLEFIAENNNRLTAHLYNISQTMNSFNARYNDYVNYLDNMKNIPKFSMADRYASAIYGARDLINPTLLQQGENAYKYWEVRENSKIVINAIINWIESEIEKEIGDIKATVMNFAKSSITVFDPKHGEIQTEVHLPIPLRSLDVIPTVDVSPLVSRAQKYIPRLPTVSLPSADVSAWLPPFDATAFVKGNTVTTFDGRQYELDSTCTYLLARDFVDGNFSVILNKDDNSKSLIVLTNGVTVVVDSNGKVSINGQDLQNVTMPASLRVATIDGQIVLDGAGHFEVIFDRDQDTITVTLNGWYFGKTSGLLGTYDNEPSNDLMTSYGKSTEYVDRFVRTWDVSTSRCR